MSNDDAVRATNDDASSCKRFAVHRGYWKDPYIQYFIRAGDRKAPEINRGYYARVQGIQLLIKQFMQLTNCHCQVVNLGAGFDTTYWNLKDENFVAKNYVEVDFQGVTTRKCYYIKNRKNLLEKLVTEDGEIKFNNSDLHASDYHVVGVDMRNLAEVDAKLKECDIDKTLPTIFIAECVLVYMTSESSSKLLRWITDNFSAAFFVNYEQVNMTDRFGQVMIDNLKSRGCSLAGVEHCTSMDTQKQRFLDTGWQGVDAMDMIQVYKHLPPEDVNSIDMRGLEQLVQLKEELFSHHCLTWAYSDQPNIGLSGLGFPAR